MKWSHVSLQDSFLDTVMLCFYNTEKIAINDSKVLNFLTWLLNYLHLHELKCHFVPCSIQIKLWWQISHEILTAGELRLWKSYLSCGIEYFPETQRWLRQGPCVVVSSLLNNLALLYFQISGWQYGLMSERNQALGDLDSNPEFAPPYYSLKFRKIFNPSF